MIPDRRMLVALPLGLGLLAACSDGSPTPTAVTSPLPARPAAPTLSAAPGQPLGAFTVTCHTGSGRTASGKTDGPGMTAVDPSVVPIGTRLQVESVGGVTAADKGGAIDGRALDVWVPSKAACTSFGRKNLQVWRVPG